MAVDRTFRPHQVAVRACEPRDLLALQAILADSPEAAFWSLQAVEDVLRQSWVSAYVSEREGKVTGFIVGRRVMDEGEILNLAVGLPNRRMGDGHALVGELLKEFERFRVTKVFLEVREFNAGAIRFYSSLGFIQVGRRDGYYREPTEAALVFEKKMEIHNVVPNCS
jgi:ribosomal-protein-alanine N-acetyltransferase